MTTAPNLFSIATKELSQDAFITWLLKWSNPEYTLLNKTIHECGQALLQLMFRNFVQFGNNDILNVESDRQWDNVDVWIEVLLKDGRKLLVIIEDKVFSTEHSNQLERYKQQSIEYCNSGGFLLTCVYLKIGSEPVASLKKLQEKGFSIVTRQDIIQCLNPFYGKGSDIIDAFVEHLNKLEQAHNAFMLLPPCKWDGWSWVGFFQLIESRLDIITWHWVSNPSGGFWNLCLTWKQWHDVPVYMQIEQTRVCYKIALGEDETGLDNAGTEINKIQDYVHSALIQFASQQGYTPLRKPAAFVHRGNYRTIAVITPEDWLGDVQAILQTDHVLNNLKVILNFYHDFIDYLGQISYESVGIKIIRKID